MTAIEVSIIVPCYNEEHRIAGLLNAIHAQSYPLGHMEVIIADGKSTDKTKKVIKDFQKEHPNLLIHLIDNPKRNIPSGLNLAIRAAQGKYVVRIDAHSIPDIHYVELCVQHLESEKANNVGGVWIIKPGKETQVANAIAIAAAHPLGVGGAQYRNKNSIANFVDTVPFGSYQRDYLMDIGLFDESLLSNEDYELNNRILNAGGKVFLDPNIQCEYFARSNYSALAKQYFRYGFWKYRMLSRFPSSVKLRQFLPPLFVFGMILLLIAGFFLPILLYVWLIIALIYLFSIFLGTYLVPNASKPLISTHVLTTLAIITMHLSWGTGFLYSPFGKIFRS